MAAKRDSLIVVRLTAKEKAAIAKAAGYEPLSAYVRRITLAKVARGAK